MPQKPWIKKIEAFCEEYNIPIEYLPDTLYEPKVVPMIRGKAFEFNVMIELKNILNKAVWSVKKEKMNAQSGIHDVDVIVEYKKNSKRVHVECKLAKKEGFKCYATGDCEIRVKCMRSRTLGTSKVAELAPKLKVSEKQLSVHNDQYTTKDFDVVVTSIGNAFYRTDPKTKLFKWAPRKNEVDFLRKLFNSPRASEDQLKKLSFERLYIARSEDIAIKSNNSIVCTRRGCKDKNNCCFIPNYPIIHFSGKDCEPTNKWFPLSKAEELFKTVLGL